MKKPEGSSSRSSPFTTKPLPHGARAFEESCPCHLSKLLDLMPKGLAPVEVAGQVLGDWQPGPHFCPSQ